MTIARHHVATAREWLHSKFPAVFKGKGEEKIPLKVGIRIDTVEAVRDFEGRPRLRYIRAAINDYCQGPRYLMACREGAGRIDMDGTIAGHVTGDEQGFADHRLKDLLAKMACATKKTPAFEDLMAKIGETIGCPEAAE